MGNKELTPSYIFSQNQVLTKEIAEQLKGKRIAYTFGTYRDNTPYVTETTIGDFVQDRFNPRQQNLLDVDGKDTYIFMDGKIPFLFTNDWGTYVFYVVI